MSIKVICTHQTAVDIPNVIQINELISGQFTNDEISVALEKTAGGTGDESFKSAAFDEWLCVLKGRIMCKIMGQDNDVEVGPGETVFIEKDSKWKPWFPEDAEFIAICKPAFRPERITIIEAELPVGATTTL